jgi:MFS family permease
MAVLIMAEVCSASALAMPLPALSSWLRMYGSTIAVGWIMSSFLLVSAAVTALCSSLGDLFGRKRMLTAILMLLFVGSVMSAWSNHLGWVIAGRCVQGVSGAILPLALGLVRETVPPKRLSLGFGVMIASASVSAALSYPVAGVMTDRFGPSSIFWVLALLALIAQVGITLVLPPSTPSERNADGIDWLGGLLFAPAVALLLFAVSSGGRGGWIAAPIALGGVILLGIWLRHEWRHRAPMIDIRLLSNGYCLTGLAVMALLAAGAFQVTEVASLLLQQPAWTGAGLALTATMTGLLKLPATAAGSVSAIFAGWLGGRWGPLSCVLVGGIASTVAALSAIAFHDSTLSVFLLILTVMIGTTSVYTSVPLMISMGTPADRTSEAMGVMAVIRALFQGIGAQIVAIILASRAVVSPEGVHYPSDHAYRTVFAYMGLSTLLMVLIAALMASRRTRRSRNGRREG